MNILNYVKLYLFTVPVFFVIDMMWLGLIAKGFYRKKLDYILSPSINWTAAIIFYLIFIFGIIFFAVLPGRAKDSVSTSILYGALFGFFTYATYDLTNLATLKDWPLSVVFFDIIWGIVLCSIVASISFFIAKWIGN